MRRLALWRLERQLRALQRSYYRGTPETQPGAAAKYLSTLAEARTLWLGGNPTGRNVHLGAGGHHLRGWINVDVLPAGADVLADFTTPLPFRSGSIDLVHSEDLLEHLDRAAGHLLIAECHRILRPGGAMRLLTPDLRALIECVYLRRETDHLAWCNATLAAEGPCQALNMHLRMNGEHRFVYDEEHLTDVLTSSGFRVRRVRFNWSPVRELRYLDLRDFGLNLFLEAEK